MRSIALIMIVTLLGVRFQTAEGSELCEDPDLFASALSDAFCFDCYFPIRIAGVPMGEGVIPNGVTEEVICDCGGPFEVGVTVGSWHPTKVIEVTTTPACSSNTPLLGSLGMSDQDTSHPAFFNVHIFPFPNPLADPFGATPCAGIDNPPVMYLSEWDPTWNHENLALLLAPEGGVVGLPGALETCSVDIVAANRGEALDSLFWCAGSWGSLYPFSGMMRSASTLDPMLTSLSAIRSIALLHRLGLSMRTVGDDVLCGGVPDPFIQKSQYRMSLVYPKTETNSHHAVGESSLQWVKGRMPTAPEGRHVYQLWQWEDCCLPIE